MFIFREKEDFLLVAQRDKIARISLGVDSTFEPLPIFGLKNVIAIEFDIFLLCAERNIHIQNLNL